MYVWCLRGIKINSVLTVHDFFVIPAKSNINPMCLYSNK